MATVLNTYGKLRGFRFQCRKLGEALSYPLGAAPLNQRAVLEQVALIKQRLSQVPTADELAALLTSDGARPVLLVVAEMEQLEIGVKRAIHRDRVDGVEENTNRVRSIIEGLSRDLSEAITTAELLPEVEAFLAETEPQNLDHSLTWGLDGSLVVTVGEAGEQTETTAHIDGRSARVAIVFEKGRLLGKVVESDCTPARKCRINVEDTINGWYVSLDGKPYPVKEGAGKLFQAAIEANGDYFSMSEVGCKSRDKDTLPEPLKKLLECKRGGGSRLTSEAWA